MAFVQMLGTLVRDKEIGPRVRADRARRSAHLRHGRHVPPARHLLAARPAVQAGGRRPADVLPRGARTGRCWRKASTKAARSRQLDRRGHHLQHERPADDAVLHLLLDVRLPAHRRPAPGRPATCARAASCSAAPPAAPRSTAKACSTKTATATCSPATIPNCVSYDPTFALRGGGRSSTTACSACSPSRRTSTTTSP